MAITRFHGLVTVVLSLFSLAAQAKSGRLIQCDLVEDGRTLDSMYFHRNHDLRSWKTALEAKGYTAQTIVHTFQDGRTWVSIVVEREYTVRRTLLGVIHTSWHARERIFSDHFVLSSPSAPSLGSSDDFDVVLGNEALGPTVRCRPAPRVLSPGDVTRAPGGAPASSRPEASRRLDKAAADADAPAAAAPRLISNSASK